MEVTDVQYKESEVGKIPLDWEVRRLSECCKKITDGTHDTPKPVYTGVPFLTAIHVKQNYIDYKNCYFLPKEVHEVIYKRCNPEYGDVLMVNIGAGVATTALIDVDFEFSLKNVALLKPNRNIISGAYLHHYQSYVKQIIADTITSGGAQPFLSLKQIAELQISLPTKSEQTAIATALSDTDALIENLEKLIDKKRNIKQGVMQELLKPKPEWIKQRLGELLEYEQPTKYLVKDSEYNDNNLIPVLTAGKTFILGYTDEDFGIYEDVPVIIFDDFTTATKFVTFPFKAKSSAMKMLKAKNKLVNLRLIYEIMQTVHFPLSDHKRYWISEFQNIEVNVPSPHEQEFISQILSDMDLEIESLERKLKKYKMVKQGMMQSLLTGKIRLI